MSRLTRSFLCLLLVVVMLVGCTPTSNPDPTEAPEKTLSQMSLEERLSYYSELGTSPDDNYRTWYEIFVYSFCDSNGDGIGDLQGVISKLDYLQELGINGIWLMPIHPSTSYHKYNVNDYYAIDPAYGTMADFEQFMGECEKRDIHVILDLVVNHSGDQNEWFLTAADYMKSLGLGEFGSEEDCPEFGYYNFLHNSEEIPEKGFGRVPGTDYYYECQFSGDMPDLNLANEDLRRKIEDVMKFWMDKGVAGFRVDAAKEFYTGNVAKNVEVMDWLMRAAKDIDPDAYMVAEVWEYNHTTLQRYYESGFTSIFNYAFGDDIGKLIKVVNGKGNPTMATSWATAQVTVDSAFKTANPNYIDAQFTSNHDVGRIYAFVNGDELRIKMAGAVNLFLSGSSFIYYGEEIGMVGTKNDNDPSKRAPFYWNAERNNGTTNPPPTCTVPSSYPLGSLAEQQANDASVYNYYREAIAIRQAIPSIARGVPSVEDALNQGCVSAVRHTWNDQECIILEHFDDEATTVDLSAYGEWELAAVLSADGNPIELDGTTLNLAAYGIAILVPKA